MIKYFILIFGFFVTIEALRYCESHSECDESECCAHMILGIICRKRPKEGDKCQPYSMIYKEGNTTYDIHYLDCMCGENMICEVGEDLDDKTPRCRPEKSSG